MEQPLSGSSKPNTVLNPAPNLDPATSRENKMRCQGCSSHPSAAGHGAAMEPLPWHPGKGLQSWDLEHGTGNRGMLDGSCDCC